MTHNFPSQLRQMRIAAMARVRSHILDLGRNPCWTRTQHDDPAGKEHGLFHVVGYQKCGEARALPQRHELLLHGNACQGVELTQRLVENEKLRIVHQRPCQGRALRHSSRKLAGISRGESSEADEVQYVIHALAMACKQSTRFEPERDVAPNAAPGIKRWVLKNDDA